jgi:hypothetical protein
MSCNQINFSYALWNSLLGQAMLQQGDTTYLVTYHDDEHCTLIIEQGQATPTSSRLSLVECEDYFGERKLLRGWIAVQDAAVVRSALNSARCQGRHPAKERAVPNANPITLSGVATRTDCPPPTVNPNHTQRLNDVVSREVQ